MQVYKPCLQVKVPQGSILSTKVVLALDCGCKLRAHRVHASRCQVLATALAIASSCAADASPLTIKVPCVSGLQACLLLQVCSC